MEQLTEKQVNSIINSFKKVFEKNDVTFLNKPAYNFIMLSSGFIAHYNIFGFCDHYKCVYDFAAEIHDNRGANMWTNFLSGEKDYEYYRQKALIYGKIADMAESFLYK
jgi:hypothetical protein